MDGRWGMNRAMVGARNALKCEDRSRPSPSVAAVSQVRRPTAGFGRPLFTRHDLKPRQRLARPVGLPLGNCPPALH
jgi:hypothetical protein